MFKCIRKIQFKQEEMPCVEVQNWETQYKFRKSKVTYRLNESDFGLDYRLNESKANYTGIAFWHAIFILGT